MSELEGVRPFVVLESPYASKAAKKRIEHHNYAKTALRDSMARGESPFLSHLFYTQFLNDLDPAERKLGMEAGWAMLAKADFVAVYLDLGWSDGMVDGVIRAEKLGLRWEKRKIGWPLQEGKKDGKHSSE